MKISDYGAPKHRNELYPETHVKLAHSNRVKQFYRDAGKLLGASFTIKTHFNPGGIAVWGETYAKIYQVCEGLTPDAPTRLPVVEAFDYTSYSSADGGIIVRQWNGKNSGGNIQIQTLFQFVEKVRELASKPFVRF